MEKIAAKIVTVLWLVAVDWRVDSLVHPIDIVYDHTNELYELCSLPADIYIGLCILENIKDIDTSALE